MNEYLVTDAINYLDTDMLAKHLKKKESLRNKSKSKKKMNILKWFTTAACFCLVLVLSVFLMNQIQNRPSEPSDFPGTDDIGVGENNGSNDQPNNSLDFNRCPAITSMYDLNEYSSMIKVEVNSVLGKYSLGLGEPTVLLVEFSVIEDYYEKISPSSTITVPIAMDGTGITNETMLTDIQVLLNDADEFILYIDRLYDKQSVYYEDGSKVDMSNVASLNLMIFNTIIPIENEIVDVSTVYELLDEYEISHYSPEKINGYLSFVADGMPIDTLEHNIKMLYQWHLTEQQSATESQPADKGYD